MESTADTTIEDEIEEIHQELHANCILGDLSALASLLSKTPPTSINDALIQDLTTRAVKHTHLHIITYLLTTYPTTPISPLAIQQACYQKSIPLFDLLLAKDPTIINTPFPHSGTALSMSLSGASPIQFITYLLCNAADPNYCNPYLQDASCLSNAASYYPFPQSIEVIHLLLSYGARFENSNVLREACFHGNLDMVEWLLENGVEPGRDSLGRRKVLALNVAVRDGRRDIVRVLRENGAGVEWRDWRGRCAWDFIELKEDREEWVDILRGEGGWE